MKRRIQKKKHLGQFKIYGVAIKVERNTTDDQENFLDEFIKDAIDDQDFFFGGGFDGIELEGFVELGMAKNNPEAGLDKLKSWLEQRSDLKSFKLGNIVDAVYGPFKELE